MAGPYTRIGPVRMTPTINGFPIVVTIMNDHRVRLPGEAVIVGDRVVRGDGEEVEVVAARQVGTREFLVAAPREVMKLLERPTERFGKDWCSRTDDPADSRNVLEPDGPAKRMAEVGIRHMSIIPDEDVPADGVGRFEVPLSPNFQPRPFVVASEE